MQHGSAQEIVSWLKSGRRHSRLWLEGFQAAEAGHDDQPTPYSWGEDWFVWHDGWSACHEHPSLLSDNFTDEELQRLTRPT